MVALALLALAGLAVANPVQVPLTPPPAAAAAAAAAANPRPLVIWHGLGDTAHSEGMDAFADRVKELHPGIFVHSVVVPEGGSAGDERNAGWWGKAEELAQQGCDQIADVEELQDGFDAIGFSQGGLFLRYCAQYSDGPAMRNLITFGSPHFGIAALIPCPDPPTLSCRLAARAARSGIYTSWAQSHLVQAAYYRDPARLDEFLLANTFMRNMNGEGLLDDEDAGNGLGHLENMVAIAFTEDKTVFPGLSAHWATVDPEDTTVVVELGDQQLYTEDLIGLRALNETGHLILDWCPGEHMQIGGDGGCGDQMVEKWVGWKK